MADRSLAKRGNKTCFSEVKVEDMILLLTNRD